MVPTVILLAAVVLEQPAARDTYTAGRDHHLTAWLKLREAVGKR